MKAEAGTLREDEHHPAADDAMLWLRAYITRKGHHEVLLLLESFFSCGIEDNRLAEVCGETLRRVLHGEPVSDRYLLGLCWVLRNMEEIKEKENANETK